MKNLKTEIGRARTAPSPDYMSQVWLHSALLAAAFIATIAVGIASAAIHSGPATSTKSDRLPVAEQSAPQYEVVETRGDGVSVLERLPKTASN